MTNRDEFEIRVPPSEPVRSQDPIELETLEEYPYKSVALGSTHANLTGLWRYWRPYFQDKRAPCDASCPVGNQVVDFIQTLLAGHWSEAASILRHENPLPAITGRLCHRPCEISCNRRQLDERIAIHHIEAVLAEVVPEPLTFPPAGHIRHVAVVGSGPAELAFAYFMDLLQHRVSLYESAPHLGGAMRYGPQARHLPDGLLDREIERIVADRISVQQKAIALTDLERGVDAVFGTINDSEHFSLYIKGRETGELAGKLNLGHKLWVTDEAQEATIKVPRRISEAIGYGKWAALLLDADWRGLDPKETLERIQMGGNYRVVSSLKYLAVLTEQGVPRSEEVVTYDKLHLDMLETMPAADAASMERAQAAVATRFVTVPDIERALNESGRCFSCGRCNKCDNCWVYCPDVVISRNRDGYEIDYAYCKGCQLCAAVCPRSVVSIIEEEQWKRDSASS